MATEMQERTDADVDMTEWATKADVDAVSTKVDELAETVDEHGAKINELTETVDKQSAKLNELTEVVGVLATTVDKLSFEVGKTQVALLRWVAWILGALSTIIAALVCTLVAIALQL